LVPPPNPRGTASLSGWCHQPPRMVPPVSLRGWCHPSVRLRQEARNSATRQFGAPPSWCHPPVRRGQIQAWGRSGGRLVPPASPKGPTGATRQFGRGQLVPPVGSSPAGSVGKPETVPPVSSESRLPGATSRQAGATRQIAQIQLVPPVGLSPAGSARKPETVPRPSSSPARCKLGATPQSGGRKWRRCCGPLRPELLPFARSCRLWGFTHRRWLCWPGDPERKASRLKKLSSPTR
jgi:hypothetical protein